MNQRVECKSLINEAVTKGARKWMACKELGISIRTIERWETLSSDARKGPLKKPSNSLSPQECAKILEVANSQEFANSSPWQIVPILADRGIYLASESTFYRMLRNEELLIHRSKSRPPQVQKPEELIAIGPNQIWSWDITYLKSAIKGIFYYLYLPMDIFSRKIIHWEVNEAQSDALAAGMIEVACEKEGISRNQIQLHSDNGSPMKGATMLATLQRLGIVPSFSRPSVSDDNPFSEALFKTLKYCPSFPEKGFSCIEEARLWVGRFVHWYNDINLHSGINWVTPTSRHNNEDKRILDQRDVVYRAAQRKNPNRWSKQTRSWRRVDIVKLNPGRRKKTENNIQTA